MKSWGILLRAEWDRVAGWSLVLAGAIAVLLASRGAADTPYVSDQIAFVVSGGIGGLVLVAVGVGLLISADLHDEWRKLDRIEAAIRGEAAANGDDDVNADAAPADDYGPNGEGESRPWHGVARADVSVLQRASQPQGRGPAVALTWRPDGSVRIAVLSGLLIAVASAFVTDGWRRAAESTEAGDATAGAAFGVVGLMLAAMAVAAYPMWLQGRLGSRKRALLSRWLPPGTERRPGQSPGRRSGSTGTANMGTDLVLAEGGQRYHRTGCPVLEHVTGPVKPVDPRGHDAVPCGICLPR